MPLNIEIEIGNRGSRVPYKRRRRRHHADWCSQNVLVSGKRRTVWDECKFGGT